MISMVFPNIETSKIVTASAEVLWRILTDTAQWVRWGPSIQDVECSERQIKKGSKGRVQTALGFWLSFEVTDYFHERYWSWRVGGICATGHRIEPIANGLCRLVFEVPLLAAPYVMICHMAIRRIVLLAQMKSNTHMINREVPMPNWRQGYYDRFSSVYDRFVALHSSDRQGDLRAYLAKTTEVSSGGAVLDICAGTGSLLGRLAVQVGQGGLAVGIDFSRGMLSVAKNKLALRPTVSLVQADAAYLPFKHAVFDAVTCAHAFYELKGTSQNACLREVLRVLKPAKPFFMMEHEIPRNRFIRLLFYVRLLSMGAKRAVQILRNEKQLLQEHFSHVQKLVTPTGHSKIWRCASSGPTMLERRSSTGFL